MILPGFAALALPSLLAAQDAAHSSDLQVTKNDKSTLIAAGRQLVYTIEVRNLGPDEAENVVITDRVPDEARLVSAGSCANDSGVLTCNIGRLKSGQTSRVSVTVAVNPGATGTIVTSATVNSSTADPNQANNSGTDSDTVIFSETDLAVTLTANTATAAADQNVVYTLQVSNSGPSDSPSPALDFSIPDGMTFVSATGDGQESDGKVSWSLDQVKVNGRARVEVTLAVKSDATAGEVIASATINADSDPSSDNNTATASVTIE